MMLSFKSIDGWENREQKENLNDSYFHHILHLLWEVAEVAYRCHVHGTFLVTGNAEPNSRQTIFRVDTWVRIVELRLLIGARLQAILDLVISAIML